MFCPCCKQELIGTEPFCPGCGTYITADMIVNAEAEHYPTVEYAKFFCLGMMAAFILTCLLGIHTMLMFIPLVFLRLNTSRISMIPLGGLAGAALGYAFMLMCEPLPQLL